MSNKGFDDEKVIRRTYRTSWTMILATVISISVGILYSILFEALDFPHDWGKISFAVFLALVVLFIILTGKQFNFIKQGYESLSYIKEDAAKIKASLDFVFQAEAAMRSLQKNRNQLIDLEEARRMETATKDNKITHIALVIADVKLETGENSFQDIIVKNIINNVSYEYFIPSEEKVKGMIQKIFRAYVNEIKNQGNDISDKDSIRKNFMKHFRTRIVNGTKITNTCVIVDPKDAEPYGWIVPVIEKPELMVRVDEHYNYMICEQMEEWRKIEQKNGGKSYFPELHADFIENIWTKNA